MFAAATAISATTGSLNATNHGASVEENEPFHTDRLYPRVTGGRSVWWKWTAPHTGTAWFAASSSSYEMHTLLGAYVGSSLETLTSVGRREPYINSRQHKLISFDVSKDAVYYIAVDGGGGSYGDLFLTWNLRGYASADDWMMYQ